MSRIHEALKKAELDRAGIQPADAAATEPRTSSGGETRRLGSAASTDVLVHPSIAVPPPSVIAGSRNPLRFDDIRANCLHPQLRPDANTNVFHPGLSAQAAEQFRTLRSRLYQLRSSQPLRSVLITSSVAAEGKTFVASNLARALARQSERRVLVIDGDLRCSRLHVPFGALAAPGLSDYLRGEADEMAVIQNGQDSNLCIIAGGKAASNPSELLSNGRVKTLLDRVGSAFDWILFDSAPCLPVADANLLADFCDGLLLVVRAGATPLTVAQRACQELQGRNVAGVVLNAMQENALDNYGSYYGTGSYGNEDGKIKEVN